MLLEDLLDIDLLDRHIQDGLVSERLHPIFPLKILNYTPEAQFSGTWDSVTRLCRGLIVEVSTGRVVARPFAKFFNLNTSGIPETEEANLPASAPLVTEKADGSMGLCFYHGEWQIATRGSFSSDQALWANSWYASHVKSHGSFNWPEGYTPVFEIIYKENQIVVSYQFEGLVLLGLVEIATGREIGRGDLERWGNQNYVPVIKVFNKSLSECAAENLVNFEGYVLTYPNGLKIKLKQENYLVLHRILTGLNPKAVWEMLSTGQDEKVAALLSDQKIPETFKVWLSGWVTQLRYRYAEIERDAQAVLAGKPGGFRKDDALYFKQTPQHMSLLFAMLDGKSYAEIIWDRIAPKGKTFKKDGES